MVEKMNKKFFPILLIGIIITFIGAVLLALNTMEILGLLLFIIGIILLLGSGIFYFFERRREIEEIELTIKRKRLQELKIMREQRKKEENYKRDKWNAQRENQVRVDTNPSPYRKRQKRKQ